jgi:1-aminocyclopropane-1-carboxylate deaminase/D-cysteine desulfhydrase-like pyridoxal-dependent ACC family enzyme
MNFIPSPLQRYRFRDIDFFLKRDDLLHVDFSGNKARKFHYFLNQELSHVKRVVSYGSNQSNAMYSLSVLAKLRAWKFIYFCEHIPEFLQNNPIGNYKYALQNGMHIITSNQRAEQAHALKDTQTLIIEEGGRQSEAEYGVKILAEELQSDIETYKIKNPYIFLPSGTGTTALYLQKHLHVRVFTCSTVGDDDYLKEQWYMVEKDERYFPQILSSKRKYHYGKIRLELYELWKELREKTGVTYDLLYDMVGWIKFLENYKNIEGTPIYIHQGGLKGNESMLQRYQYKYDIMK